MGPNGAGEWLDQFKGTPFFADALEIQKEDSAQDLERAKEQAASDMTYAQRAMFRVRVAEMEAQLQEWKYQQMGLGDAPVVPEEGMEQPPSAPIAPPGALPPPAPKMAGLPVALRGVHPPNQAAFAALHPHIQERLALHGIGSSVRNMGAGAQRVAAETGANVKATGLPTGKALEGFGQEFRANVGKAQTAERVARDAGKTVTASARSLSALKIAMGDESGEYAGDMAHLPAKAKTVLAIGKAVLGTQQIGRPSGEKTAFGGTGYGAAVSPKGSEVEGALRGAAGGAAGGILGGLALGIPTAGIGVLPGFALGAHKGMRMATEGLAKKRGLTPEDQSEIATRASLGGFAGNTLGGLAGIPVVGGPIGGYLGARTHKKLHGKGGSKKEGSISEYRQLTQKVASGAFGTEAQAALQGILSARPPTNTQTKVASVYGPPENVNDLNDAKRRLSELLHKQEPTGTDGGSVSPNPSRDAT
jgi:hypothetical protein